MLSMNNEFLYDGILLYFSGPSCDKIVKEMFGVPRSSTRSRSAKEKIDRDT
jgi:hypothetical protein